MSSIAGDIDAIEARFDDPTLVADAGLILIATLTKRLDLEALINSTVRLVGRVGGFGPGRKLLTLIHAICAGATHIDHVGMLRAGATAKVLGHKVMAPSTIGTFLRAFTWGHARQLDRVIGIALRRVWSVAGPGKNRLVLDLDSTICVVSGKDKQGASYGYTKQLGLHPLVASRADTGEVLHFRLRKGSAGSARGARPFITELVNRVRRSGASGEIVLRADSAFWAYETLDLCESHGIKYSITIDRNTAVTRTISQIPQDAWVPIEYTDDGEAQVAETIYNGRRLIVRRTKLTDPDQLAMWPDWRYHAFLTNLPGDAVGLDKFHRCHARVELVIRDLKEGGMNHMPSGNFAANCAWLAATVFAHNLIIWADRVGGVDVGDTITTSKTARTQRIKIAARIVNHSGKPILRLPTDWPWKDAFHNCLNRIRALPSLC